MQEYGIITTLPYSKYSSPIFAQRKPNGKLRILVDQRRINHLLKNDYNQHNHPVTTIADAAQHMAGKKYFCKLDCSQAYHCLQMADEQSIQLLAFNFGSRTFAYLRLAQGLNRSQSAFNSTVREYVDALVKADKFAQYVDDIGIAAHTVDELLSNIEAVFQQIQKAGLKLSMSKCAFGHPQIDFHPHQRVSPHSKTRSTTSSKNQIAHINQIPPKVHRVCPVLQAVHTTPSRKTHPTVQTTPKRRQIPVDPAAQGHHLRD